MNINLTIPLNIPQLAGGMKAFPNLEHAVRGVAASVHKQWMAYAQGAPLPDGQRLTPRTGGYLGSIQIRQIDNLHWEIFSDSPYAGSIEYGSPPRDLKQMLQTSAKVRRFKDGRRYLIIPFHHGTGTGSGEGVSFGGKGSSGVMPDEIYNLARQLNFSREIGRTTRESGNYPGVQIDQRIYSWAKNTRNADGHMTGGRLTKKYLASNGFDAVTVKRYQGMVRMHGPGQTQYLTFRIMAEGSSGWIRPAIPGKYPAKQTANLFLPEAQRLFDAACATDVQQYLQYRRP